MNNNIKCYLINIFVGYYSAENIVTLLILRC